MATEISEVQVKLDEVVSLIHNSRQRLSSTKTVINTIEDLLADIPLEFASLITAINNFTPTGPTETAAKDLLAKLTTEFQALKAAATTAKASLSSITEF